MFEALRDSLTTMRLRARYQRLVHERLLELTESSSPRPVSDEPGHWQLLGEGKGTSGGHRCSSTRERARRLARENPHASNILRLLEAYVVGPGLHSDVQPVSPAPASSDLRLVTAVKELWQHFLTVNGLHYCFREHARRTWRDGECFIRKFPGDEWPPSVRFVDPETIVPTADAPETQGILTDPDDVETPVAYLKMRPGNSSTVERVPADFMLQTRQGVDSNEKRGVSILAPVLDAIACYERWLETEMLARKLQSSIVLWRKVQGSAQMAESAAERAGVESGFGRDTRRERFSPGTILTTNQGTDIQFLQPNTNFGDAVPLGRMLLLSVAAGAGLPEFMLTADASNANFASTMVAEGPAVKFFQSEQQFFAAEFTRLWRWVMQDAVEMQLLPDDLFERVTIRWTFPVLVSRDRSKERLADVRLIETGVLSRAEVARREGVDPIVMQSEREKEAAGQDAT